MGTIQSMNWSPLYGFLVISGIIFWVFVALIFAGVVTLSG